ncbi:MAG: hypothetical protein LQ351_007721 [Letrouitia transgressa]|nr:MAG: hypothetical protein LQ351_007721 [Letrouitia transgressa]
MDDRPVLTSLPRTRVLDFDEAGVQLTTCPDGSYCCGPSNKECCAAGEGSHIDKNGVIIISGQISSSIAWHPPPASTSRPHRTAAVQSGPSTSTNANSQLSATAAGATSTGASLPTPSVSNDGGDNGSSSLSSGAKAGIGIGCAVGVSLIVLLLFLLLRERKKRREMEQLPEVRQWAPLADRKPVIATASMQELPAGGQKVLRSEIDGKERAGELYSS